MGTRPITPILSCARAEAEHAGHGYVGVEHLLLALAQPATSTVRQWLGRHGITLDRVRDAVRLVVGTGRGDGPRFDATTLLATLGIDLDLVRHQVEHQFGPDAIRRLYNSEVGWNLHPRGPLCELPMTPQLKAAMSSALGACWDNEAPSQLQERLLLAALDSETAGLVAVLDELHVTATELHAAVAAELRLAS